MSINLLNWTQQVWDENAKNPNLRGMKKWSKLDLGFQKYLLEKVEGCTSKEEVRAKLEEK